MKKILILFIAVFFTCLSISAQPRTGLFAMSFQNGAATSNMYFFVPEDYDSTKAYPMLFGWHGAGMPGNNMRDLLYLLICGRLKFLPDGSKIISLPGWTICADRAKLSGTVQQQQALRLEISPLLSEKICPISIFKIQI